METDDAEAPPLVEGTAAEAVYCDGIEFMDLREGNVRVMLWRWRRLAGELVREPVRELIFPEATAMLNPARIARAIAAAKERMNAARGGLH